MPWEVTAAILLRCNYCAWSPGEEVSSAPPPHQSAPGSSRMSLGGFGLQRVVVAVTICSLLWGHRRASCSWYLCGVSSRRLPLKVWLVLIPSALLGVSYVFRLPVPTAHLWSGIWYLCSNTSHVFLILTTILEPLLQKFYFRLAFLKPCSIEN